MLRHWKGCGGSWTRAVLLRVTSRVLKGHSWGRWPVQLLVVRVRVLVLVVRMVVVMAEGSLVLQVVDVLVMVGLFRIWGVQGLRRALGVVPDGGVRRSKLAVVVGQDLLSEVALELQLVDLLRHDPLVHVLALLQYLLLGSESSPIEDERYRDQR
uniref:(northern house mosquito) hypothetical protein n=1 Tax=Culex pipiens TaxID=7175 RepID=A0A8D8JH87_CULPI